MKSLLRPMANAFPGPMYRLRWWWSRMRWVLPWNLLRYRAAVRSAQGARSRPRTANQLVMVADRPRFREAKIAEGLLKLGWEVVLLYLNQPDFEPSLYFSRSERYQDSWDALQKASVYSPMAYHVFGNWDYSTAELFVRHRPGKVVFDPMDVLGGIARPRALLRYPGQVMLERYCLENADGVCCRALETQYLKRVMGYRFRGRRIFFPDFSVRADSSSAADTPIPSDEEIHVVHIGSITLEKAEPEYTTGHFLKVAQSLAREGIHFHLYGGVRMSGRFEDLYADFLDLGRRTGFVHVHREVPMPQLIRELRGYTFGLLIAGERLHFRDFDFNRPRHSHDIYAPSRVFEYVRAGLPVILHEGRFLFWLTSRLGKAILVDEGLLVSPAQWLRARMPTAEQRRTLMEKASYVEAARHAPRLAKYYASL